MLNFTLYKTLLGPGGTFRLEVGLSVADGEILALFGPSGVGKTSVLRMLAGLLPPDKGRISLHDKDLTDTPAGQRGVGFVFQDYGLFPNMTVAENMAFAGGEEMPAVFGLGALADRYPYQLSGGQQQRVAVARSLVQGPDILLLDEPLSALERPLRRELGNYLKQAVQRRNIPCLLVSHDPKEVLLLADRVAVLEAGKVVNLGPPAELLLPPAENGQIRAVVLRLEGQRMEVRVGEQRLWVALRPGVVVGEEVFLSVS